jgi:predicted HTH domain antitoxin
MTILAQDLVEAGIYPDAATAVQEALRVLWQERPSVRINVAVHRYNTEDLSLAKAADLAGVSFDRMKEIMAERGIPLRLGPETIPEAHAEVEALGKMSV